MGKQSEVLSSFNVSKLFYSMVCSDDNDRSGMHFNEKPNRV